MFTCWEGVQMYENHADRTKFWTFSCRESHIEEQTLITSVIRLIIFGSESCAVESVILEFFKSQNIKINSLVSFVSFSWYIITIVINPRNSVIFYDLTRDLWFIQNISRFSGYIKTLALFSECMITWLTVDLF